MNAAPLEEFVLAVVSCMVYRNLVKMYFQMNSQILCLKQEIDNKYAHGETKLLQEF